MPYKEKHKIARGKWVENNRELIYEKQQRYQLKCFIKKYSPLVQEIQFYNIEEKAIKLRPVHGRSRKKIYKHFNIPFADQIEQEIKRIVWRSKEQKKYYSYKKENKKKNNKIRFIKKYSPLVQKIQSYSILDKAKILHNIHGSFRKKIYNYFIIPFPDQIEKEIKRAKTRGWAIEQKPAIKKRIDNRWNYVKNWMTTKGCDCGEKDITRLTFHHLDPSKKENTIRKICRCSFDKVKKELEKGVVKCKNCHTIIHAGTSQEREESLIKQFLKSSISKKSSYRNKLMIWEYKKSLSCIKCGIYEPVILLFHHIDSKLKSEKISIMYKKGRYLISKELSKTICLCQNCHEEFHVIYGTRTNKEQLEKYLNKKVIPIKVDINDYLPIMSQNISQFYNLPFLIT